MLKGIPSVISPELMKALLEMGHGDEIVIADGNFPAASIGPKVIRADGHEIPELLEAILQFFPLDTYADANVIFMGTGMGWVPPVWDVYKRVLQASGENFAIQEIGRFEFYERAAKAYAIIATGEKALYANVIIKKGVVNEEANDK